MVFIRLSDCFRSVRVFSNRLKSLQLGSCTLHSKVSRIDFWWYKCLVLERKAYFKCILRMVAEPWILTDAADRQLSANFDSGSKHVSQSNFLSSFLFLHTSMFKGASKFLTRRYNHFFALSFQSNELADNWPSAYSVRP